jgi:hypothetical protein
LGNFIVALMTDLLDIKGAFSKSVPVLATPSSRSWDARYAPSKSLKLGQKAKQRR